MKQFCHCNTVNYSETVNKVLKSDQPVSEYLRKTDAIIKNAIGTQKNI